MVRCKCWVRVTCKAEPTSLVYKIIKLLQKHKQKYRYDIEKNLIQMTLTDEFVDNNIEILMKLSSVSGFLECKCWSKNLCIKSKLARLNYEALAILFKEKNKVRIRVIDSSKTTSKTIELLSKGIPVTIPSSLYIFSGEKLWLIYNSLKSFIKEKLNELVVVNR